MPDENHMTVDEYRALVEQLADQMVHDWYRTIRHEITVIAADYYAEFGDTRMDKETAQNLWDLATSRACLLLEGKKD
jgi:hypothetical protein